MSKQPGPANVSLAQTANVDLLMNKTYHMQIFDHPGHYRKGIYDV